jgi:hypothetical protein
MGREKVLVETSGIKRDAASLATSNLVYLSLGSNVGEREAQLREAQSRLGAAGRIVAASSFYETEPVEFTPTTLVLELCGRARHPPDAGTADDFDSPH